MGELAEIGRRGWSGKSQLLTGWLCDGWVLGLVCFGLGLSGFGLEFGDGGVGNFGIKQQRDRFKFCVNVKN